MPCYSLTHLSDPVLLRDLAALVARERVTTAELLAHLAEVDARRLYLPAAYPSMYAWCVGELRLSEDSAFKRIRAARTAREFPAIFPMLADGRLHLCGVILLAPHLAPDNVDALLAATTHQSKATIERLLAERFPQPDVPTLVLAGTDGGLAPGPLCELSHELAPGPVETPSGLPAPGCVGSPAERARLTPLSPERFALQVTLAQVTHDKLRYAQALLGHAVPSKDLAQVLDRALDALIARLEQRRFAASARPRAGRQRQAEDTRYVPAATRRAVWQHDGGQCTFVSDTGHRCEARTRLEFDHIEAFARGGQATPAGLRLRCRAHNQFEAERTYGTDFMRHKREQARRRADEECVMKQARQATQAADQQREAARLLERQRAETLRARQQEVVPWLRQLGFRVDEARRAAALCDALPDAPLDARVRAALSSLAPSGARRVPSIASVPGA